ncbi:MULTISPECIES: AAA family ATPase [Paenibacillus]|uniref:AAA family ATPase n=1 Tax=Paenibacillus TaxID=44249 RepID=UPI00096C9A1B|nr:AAA family ATPase [Paenibacillus sp. FSL H8-0259]OMF30249.1 nucleotide kinase [Paenibacillus sp. FSL H8-0259]
MKKLIIVNGTMGVGKSSICKQLFKSLDRSVWLDGDWCWMMQPWTVNDENIIMVENNINYLLHSFLTNTSFDYVIFSWVLHRKEMIDRLLARLSDLEFEHQVITLTCSESALRQRMQEDHRTEEQINRSLERVSTYAGMPSHSVDTSEIGLDEVVLQIKDRLL